MTISSRPRTRVAVRRLTDLRPAFVLLLAALMALMLVTATASAQSLDDLRAQGVVGERFDGVAEVRSSGASAEIRQFVSDVNAQRLTIYADRAKQQGVPVGQVARIYAKQIYDKLPSGAWFLDEGGSWRQK